MDPLQELFNCLYENLLHDEDREGSNELAMADVQRTEDKMLLKMSNGVTYKIEVVK